MGKLIALVGMLAGGYIGFLNRPEALIKGKLSFEEVVFAGTNLKGFEKVYTSVARTSFNDMLIGAIIGLLGGIILALLLFRSKKC
jgi:ABC-type nitrate/sulfonate/bicarbonate transport system permease component